MVIDVMTPEQKKARTVLNIDGWILWDWMDPSAHDWDLPYSMFHRCGIEKYHPVWKRHDGFGNYEYLCKRCEQEAPEGLVVLYQFMNWEAGGDTT